MKYKIIPFILIISLITSCEFDKQALEPERVFTRIYHDANYSTDYRPIDLIQTPDSGYLILSAYMPETQGAFNWWYVNLLKTDSRGELEWLSTLDDPFMNPVGEFMIINGEICFTCMNASNLSTYLVKVDLSTGGTVELANFPSLTYPLYASAAPDGSAIIQSYEKFARISYLSKIGTDMLVKWSTGYNVIEDVEEQLIYHVIKTRKLFPLFTGSAADGSYHYMNSFNNYSVSLAFVNDDGSKKGQVNGFRYSGAVSNASNLSGSAFALSRYSNGSNYIYPIANINTDDITHTDNLAGAVLHELQPDAKVISKIMDFSGVYYTIFASNTQNNQIVLYFYQAESGTLFFTKYIGNSIPFEVAGMIKTSDNGIAIAVRTYEAGRFPRVGLIKLSFKEIAEDVKEALLINN